MKKYYKLTFIVLLTVYVFLSIAVSGSLAQSTDEPVVVRKKIETRNEEDVSASFNETAGDTENKRPFPGPRFDLAQLKDTEEVDKEVDEIFVAENNSANPSYSPKCKIDPFEPLFKSTFKSDDNTSFTPKPLPEGHIAGDLEKIDLSQLKLTGVVVTTNRNLGLVQEATGKGHIIYKGSYIGTRGGRVVDILKNKVVIKETMENNQGRIVAQKKELKITKKAN